MRALAVLPGARDVRVVEHPEPSVVDPHHVMVRMLEVGVCGTDREIAAFLYGAPPPGSEYLVLGHESLGEVVEVGKDVTSVAPGDLVAWIVRRPCGRLQCRPCAVGRQDFCITGDFTERGIKEAHGFLTEYVVDDERYAVKLPAELRDVGVLIEPLTIAEKAAEQLRVVLSRLPGDITGTAAFRRAVVLGAGPVGLLGAMKLMVEGFDTWVYSRGPSTAPSADVATAIGARFVSSDAYSPAQLSELVGGFSVVYEATGAARISFEVLAELGHNGAFVFTGVPGRLGPIEFDAASLMRDMVLENQLVLGTVNAGRSAFEEAVTDLSTFMERFPDAVRALITSRIRIDQARDAVVEHRPGIKTVVSLA